jgi:sRNA-binding regulator protein Hfq
MDKSSVVMREAIWGRSLLRKGRIRILLCVLLVSLTFCRAGTAGGSENERDLLRLAREKFGRLTEGKKKLTEAEEKLFRAVANGGVADYSAEDANDNDPADANNWGRERVIDANRIAWLCTDKRASELVMHGGIWVKGACIDGEIDLLFAKVPFPLYFEKSAVAKGFHLAHAGIPALNLAGTRTGPIGADGLKVEHSVFLRYGFKADGEVRLVGATIGGNLDCRNGQFNNERADALSADGVKVEGDVLFSSGFRAEGEVRLLGATIGGDLACGGGQFVNADGYALNADRLKVEGDVFLADGFKGEGEVCLFGATIGGNLLCLKGQFINPNGYALTAGGLKVEGNVFLCNDFKAQGTVGLITATMDNYFVWTGVDSPEKVTLDLRSAKIGTLSDEKDSWPGPGKLLLHGLVYDEIHDDAPRDAETRIVWLRRQYNEEAEDDKDQFRPQPYEQLAEVLRKSGHDVDAKKILIAKNRDKARLTKLTWSEQLWYRAFGRIIAYGYRPWRALWIGLMLVLLGWLFFWAGYRAQVMTPAKDNAQTSAKFCAFVYSLDVFVPLVDLHQASYWLPNANLMSGRILRYYLWFEIVAGWVLTTLLVVGVTGLVRT